MQQIELPLECLIERAKHKCKRCTRFFSNEAALKQHQCELQIKKEKRPHCSKTINRANNLEKHLRSCEKAPTHPNKRQLRQTTLDRPIALESGPSTPKELMGEELQVGGAPAEHAEHWKAPEIVESALKYTALTFRKAFNSNNKRDILQQLREAIHSMRPVIEGQTRVNAEAVKWYLSLNMNFCKSTGPAVKTDPAVTFCSEVFKSINTHKLDYQFHVGYNQIGLQIDEFQCNGSSWFVHHLQHLDLGTCFRNNFTNLILEIHQFLFCDVIIFYQFVLFFTLVCQFFSFFITFFTSL